MNKTDMLEFASLVATAVVDSLKKQGILCESANPKTEKTAYQKTEQLLYNYNGFKRVVQDRLQEIEDLRKYGVPKKSPGCSEYIQKGGLPQGIVLEEESVESAVRSIQASVDQTVRIINLIDKCMGELNSDPYYCILEMRYFEGRTQEDIADYLECSQVTVSKNKSRLIKELAMRIFPNQAIQEMME